MKLYIDTHEREKVVVGVDGEMYEFDATDKKAQILLPSILETLEKTGKKLQDIKEIEVHTGPGSFTGLRVGLSVAMALGYALGVPVNGCDIKKGQQPQIKYS